MQRTLRILLTATLLASCATSAKPAVPAAPPAPVAAGPVCPAMRPPLVAGTYNTGLFHGSVPYAGQRAPHVAEAVEASFAGDGPDVLCLQEVWDDADRDTIIAASGLPQDNVYFTDTVGYGPKSDRALCTKDVLQGTRECAEKKCAGKGENVGNCVKSECESSLVNLYLFHRVCLHALVTTIGLPTIDDMVKAVTKPGYVSKAFGGRNGVLLLSRWPLRNREFSHLPSSGANRVVLYATVDVPGVKDPVDIACSHFSSPLSKLDPWQSGVHTWQEEQRIQTERVANVLARRTKGQRPALFLADTNYGPNGMGREAVHEENFDYAHTLGFRTQAELQVPPLCGNCTGHNTFRKDGGTRLLDHVMFRNDMSSMALVPQCSRQRFMETVDVHVPNAGTVTTNLSDHFGIETLFGIE